MNNEVLLTDFSEPEIQVLLCAIELYYTERNKGFFQKHKEDDVNLVRTQIRNAAAFITWRDRVLMS
jgi:hypothetical protein